MENLKRETMADLDELLDFTSELYDLYQALLDLECNGQKETSEYRRYVNRIKEIIDITSNIEDRIASNYEELKKVIMLLDEKLEVSYDPNEINCLMCYGGAKEQMVPMRIVNNLNKRYSDMINVEDVFQREGVEYDDERINDATTIAKYRRIFGSMIATSIDAMVLAKVKKEGLFQHKSLGNYFQEIKYDIAFLSSDSERELLPNNYEVDDNPYILKDGINNLLGVSKEYNNDFKIEVLDSIIGGNLEMLKKSDIEIAQEEFAGAEVIVYAYYILSALVLIDDDEKAYSVMDKLALLSDKLGEYRTFIIVKNLLDIVINDYEDAKKCYQFITIGGR